VNRVHFERKKILLSDRPPAAALKIHTMKKMKVIKKTTWVDGFRLSVSGLDEP